MHSLLLPLLEVVDTILGLYKLAVLAVTVMSWLAMANILNMRSRAVYTIMDVLTRLTEPALRPIRRVLPNFGGLDFSPLVLLLAIQLLQRYLALFVLSL